MKQGTRKNPHAVALGRLGGLVRSDAKRQANRENGRKGGLVKSRKKAIAARRNARRICAKNYSSVLCAMSSPGLRAQRRNDYRSSWAVRADHSNTTSAMTPWSIAAR